MLSASHQTCTRAELDQAYDVLDKLCRIVQNPELNDVKIIQNITSHKNTIRQITRQNEADVKKLIQEYQQKEETLQKQASNPPSRRFETQREIVVDELNQVQTHIRTLEKQVNDLESKIDILQRQKTELEKERIVVFEEGDENQSGYHQQIAVAEMQLRLFQTICPIVFDEDCGEFELRGSIHLPTLGEIRSFEYSTQETSQSDINERLWGHIWEEQVIKHPETTKYVNTAIDVDSLVDLHSTSETRQVV